MQSIGSTMSRRISPEIRQRAYICLGQLAFLEKSGRYEDLTEEIAFFLKAIISPCWSSFSTPESREAMELLLSRELDKWQEMLGVPGSNVRWGYVEFGQQYAVYELRPLQMGQEDADQLDDLYKRLTLAA